jgi:hypothetical protein
VCQLSILQGDLVPFTFGRGKPDRCTILKVNSSTIRLGDGCPALGNGQLATTFQEAHYQQAGQNKSQWSFGSNFEMSYLWKSPNE